MAAVWEKKARQSSSVPWLWAWARAALSVWVSAWPSRRVGAKAAWASEAARHSSGHRAQDGIWAELQEDPGALGVECLHRIGEAHRLSDVGHPVGGVGCLLGAEQLTGEVGDDRDLRLGVLEALGDLGEGLEYRLHQGGVKGVGDGKALGLLALLSEAGLDLGDRLALAGEDD